MVDEALHTHLMDMLTDSRRLEEAEEPAQAFDKIARGLEAVLATRSGDTQSDKWQDYFQDAVHRDELWTEYCAHHATLAMLADELSYYVAPLNREDAGRLKNHGRRFQKAVDTGGPAGDPRGPSGSVAIGAGAAAEANGGAPRWGMDKSGPSGRTPSIALHFSPR